MPIRRNPDTNTLTISFTLTKEQYGYLKPWYQSLKKVGETPSEFALRQLLKGALSEVCRTEYNSVDRNQMKQWEYDKMMDDLSAELDVISAELGVD